VRISALITRICRQLIRDKRTLALLFAAPLLILTLMYFLFNGSTVEGKLGVVNIDKSFVQALEKNKLDVIEYEIANNETILSDKLDGLLEMENGKLKLTMQMKINQTAAQIQTNKSISAGEIKVPGIETEYIYGNSDSTFFDILSPILVGFFVFFFVFLISGIGLLRERTTGTLERLMATPIRRYEVVTGYLLGYGIFAVIQTVIVVLYSVKVLNIVLVGSIWNVILINLLLAIAALSLGILLSTFAASEFQMMQFIPIAIIPQIFFAGIFPMEGMAKWLQSVGKVMPMYYAADALKGVMYKGWGFSNITHHIFALLIFSSIFIVLNIFALKKYRRL
jgi:ABC-2 type transport system permease protein